MEIPRSFKVGHREFTVTQVLGIIGNPTWRGYIRYAWGSIVLSTHRGKVPRSDRERAEAFWHETTHAILHDIGHPLTTDEKFVDAFSKRLNQVVHSVKF